MTHIEAVSQQLDTFLKHDTKRVLLLKGKWGVGKTYFFSKIYLLRCRQAKDKLIQESKVSYVSLNGVASIDDVEQLIVANTEFQNVEITQKKKIWNWGAEKTLKCLPWTENIPYLKEFQGTIRRIANLIVTDYLICIDEIERKSPDLAIDTLLGLVSMLKEHKNCRFVLIMNEDELSDADNKLFDKCREKVIDEIVTYSPAINDNIPIVFKDSSTSEYETIAHDIFTRFNINNIRIMRQVMWAIEYFQPYTKNLKKSLQSKINRNIIQLSIFHFIPSFGVDISKIAQDVVSATVCRVVGNNSDDPSIQQMQKLVSYQYVQQDFDSYIIDYLNTGHCNETQLQGALSLANEYEKNTLVQNAITNIFKLAQSGFVTTVSEVLQECTKLLDSEITRMGVADVRNVLSLMKSISVECDPVEYFDKWVRSQLEHAALSQLEWMKTLPISEAMKEEIDQRKNAITKNISVLELLQALQGANGWNPA